MISVEGDTLCALIDALEEEGDRAALISTAEPELATLTRATLLRQVHRLASGLSGLGIRRGDTVALLADSGFKWVVAALATLRAGAVILPIDSQTNDHNLRHMLEDCGARWIFTNEEHEQRLLSLELCQPLSLIRLDDDSSESEWRRLCAAAPRSLPSCAEDDNAVLFYTSGTTGPPKGVPLTHRNLMFQVKAVTRTDLIHADDRLLLPLPLNHVYPFVMGMIAPLGARLPVILPKSMTGPEVLRAIAEGQATVVIGVPRLYRALYSGIVSQVEQGGMVARQVFFGAMALSRFAKRYLGLSLGKQLLKPLHRRFGESLRLMASGGAALDAELAANLEALGWQVGTGYGLTETSPLLTLNMPDSAAKASAGKPIPGVDIRIRPLDPDDESDERGSSEQSGEIQARGDSVFRGYLGLEEQTRKAFTEDGWFRTGDLGHFDEQGYLHIEGRASTLIVTESGKNVQPDEVEDHYGQHALIAEAGVLADHGRLVALIVPDLDALKSHGGDPDAAIREAVATQGQTLPSYQRLSNFVTAREALPRTRLGKIQRHLLKERYRLASKGQDTDVQHRAGLMPAEEMSDQDHALLDDVAVRQVWQWLGRRHPKHRITPDTNLQLDLNIDSLEMLNLTMDIAQLGGVDLDEQSLARVDTVRDLLREVGSGTGSGKTLDPERIIGHPEDYLSSEQSRYLVPFNPLEALLALVGRGLAWLIMKLFFRLTVQGREHLPEDGAFLIVPNHLSVLDPIALFAATPRRVLRQTWFAGWTGMVFKNALMRLGGRLGKTVPVDPERAAASSLALGAMVLRRGNSLVWFPEGERSASGDLLPFKPGIGLLLKYQPTIVVPVAIKGTWEAMPVGRQFPRPHPVTVIFGKPVAVAELLDGASELSDQEQICQGLQNRVRDLLNS